MSHVPWPRRLGGAIGRVGRLVALWGAVSDESWYTLHGHGLSAGSAVWSQRWERRLVSIVPSRLRRSRAPTIAIEPMRRRDLKAVLPIEDAAYPTSWSRRVFESELDQVRSGSRCYLIARDGRDVVGYAGLWILTDPDGDQAHVTNIVVAEHRRREGVATRLMLRLAREAIDRSCVAWTLEVRASSTGAHALYRRFGFAPAGVRKRYYDDREDAIVMWCHDLDGTDYAERLAGIEQELEDMR